MESIRDLLSLTPTNLVLGTTKHLEKHAFLRGNFAPVSEEHVALPVEIAEGELPLGLDGAFLRNGPNPIRAIQRKRYHWFDGHAMLHTLMIKDGKATYTNQVKGQRGTTRLGFNADTIPTLPFQFIPSPRYNIELRLGEEFFPTIGEYKGVESLFICNSLMQRHCASCSFPRLAWADETIIPSSLGQAENQGLEASRPPQYKCKKFLPDTNYRHLTPHPIVGDDVQRKVVCFARR